MVIKKKPIQKKAKPVKKITKEAKPLSKETNRGRPKKEFKLKKKRFNEAPFLEATNEIPKSHKI